MESLFYAFCCFAFVGGFIYFATAIGKTLEKDKPEEPEEEWVRTVDNKDEWPGPHYPPFVCPRCHSNNKEQIGRETHLPTLGLGSAKWTNTYRCNWCGMVYRELIISGSTPSRRC